MQVIYSIHIWLRYKSLNNYTLSRVHTYFIFLLENFDNANCISKSKTNCIYLLVHNSIKSWSSWHWYIQGKHIAPGNLSFSVQVRQAYNACRFMYPCNKKFQLKHIFIAGFNRRSTNQGISATVTFGRLEYQIGSFDLSILIVDVLNQPDHLIVFVLIKRIAFRFRHGWQTI